MIKRTVEISTEGAYAHLRQRQMVVEREGETVGSAPIEDLGVLIFDGPRITVSTSLIAALAENNVAVIFADGRHLPASVLVPFVGNSIQTKILSSQVAATLPQKKRLWSRVVAAKLVNQAQVLDRCGADGHVLREMSRRVGSGDPQNIEAQGAKLYWGRLFGLDFRRDRARPDENALLNYGYAVVRAVTARALVATGLHLGFGIHHRNQYNPFPLADDLMEPVRPFVDLRVQAIATEAEFFLNDEGERSLELNRELKGALLEVLTADCEFDGRKLQLMPAIGYCAAAVKQYLSGEVDIVPFPRL